MNKHPDTVIEVENLVTHYGDREILKGVTLDVRDREIMSLWAVVGLVKVHYCAT